MDISCATAGTQGFLFTKADSGIGSLDALNAAIRTGSNKNVAFTGDGACHAICHSHVLKGEPAPVNRVTRWYGN